jgi:hypothetical protein
MIDALPAVGTAVDDDPVAAVELELLRQIANHEPHVRDQVRVIIRNRREGCDRPLGNHEHVRRRLGRDVVKRQALVIFEDDFGRYLFVDDPLKNRFLGHVVVDLGCWQTPVSKPGASAPRLI